MEDDKGFGIVFVYLVIVRARFNGWFRGFLVVYRYVYVCGNEGRGYFC